MVKVVMMKNSIKKISLAVALSFFALPLASCANNQGGPTEMEIYDPLEGVNRTTLKINNAADKVILEPLAKGYRAATSPAPVSRTLIRNFLRNLSSPVVIGNQLLQGDIEGAGNATARVVINTLAGFGGILDLAEQGGIPYEPEDFGQTLAVWGLDEGMYVMLPLLGPSTLRDATGTLVDSYADPLRIYLFNIDEQHLNYTRTASEVVSKREALIEVINDLRGNSFDYYAAVRSAYYQNRKALIADQSRDAMAADIPEYDDF